MCSRCNCPFIKVLPSRFSFQTCQVTAVCQLQCVMQFSDLTRCTVMSGNIAKVQEKCMCRYHRMSGCVGSENLRFLIVKAARAGRQRLLGTSGPMWPSWALDGLLARSSLHNAATLRTRPEDLTHDWAHDMGGLQAQRSLAADRQLSWCIWQQ